MDASDLRQVETIEILGNMDISEPIIKEIEIPEKHCLHAISAMFEGCDLKCYVEPSENNTNQSWALELENGASSIIPQETTDTRFKLMFVPYEIRDNPQILFANAEIVLVGAVPFSWFEDFELLSSCFHYHPEQGVFISIDLSVPLDIAKGCDDVLEKHVQIRSADMSVIDIVESSGNFEWRDDELLCRGLRCGQEYSIRVRYKTEDGWIDWSDRVNFTPKRKMSL